MKWCGTKRLKAAKKDAGDLEELREVCSAVLGVYLCGEMAKDKGGIPGPLEDAIDRALIVASNADKKHKFGLF